MSGGVADRLREKETASGRTLPIESSIESHALHCFRPYIGHEVSVFRSSDFVFKINENNTFFTSFNRRFQLDDPFESLRAPRSSLYHDDPQHSSAG